MLDDLLAQLPPQAKILDYGCLGWKIVTLCAARSDVEHHGCDISPPGSIPEGAYFHLVNPNDRRIPVGDDFFDCIIASHVLEHVHDPMALFQELARVCKPSGKIYIETPSERSLMVKSSAKPERHSFFSFWDDPTHIRPWPPAALYRLAISYGFRPIESRYITSAWDTWLYPLRYIYYTLTRNPHKLSEIVIQTHGWQCYIIAEKPPDMRGKPDYCNAYLREVPPGVKNALAYYQSQQTPK